MSDPNTSDNWRLEESGDATGRWKLEETEQDRISQWELQNDQSYPPTAEWQPVEYNRDPYQEERGGGGWVLPSLVGLALIAVVTYGAWIGLTQLEIGDFGGIISNLSGSPDPADDVAAAPTPTEAATLAIIATEPQQPTATTAPTNTPPPAEPTPAPLPALVEERYATVAEQYGINARVEPSTDAEVLQVVGENEEFLVVDEQSGWLQIVISPEQLAWITSDPALVTLRTQELTVDAANQIRQEIGAELLAGGSPVAMTDPTDNSADQPADSTGEITETTTITSVFEPIPTDVDVQPVTIAGTVNITGGLNARAEPAVDGGLIALLTNNTVLTLTARTTDNNWLRTSLGDEQTIAWVFAQYVTLDGELSSLPFVDETGALVPAPTPATAAPIAEAVDDGSADGTTAPADEDATQETVTETSATVNQPLGAAVRAAPENGADAVVTVTNAQVLTITGRSADSSWLQVDLGESGTGWVQAINVDLDVDVEALRVVTP